MLNLDLKLRACRHVLVRVLANVCVRMHKCVCVCSRMGEYACSSAHGSVLRVYSCGNQCAHACTHSVYTYVRVRVWECVCVCMYYVCIECACVWMCVSYETEEGAKRKEEGRPKEAGKGGENIVDV